MISLKVRFRIFQTLQPREKKTNIKFQNSLQTANICKPASRAEEIPNRFLHGYPP